MSRYQSIQLKTVEDKKVLRTVIYPEVAASEEDYYIVSTAGDRFDILSRDFYGTTEYWWVIASNNPHVRRDTLTITPGVQLRIPPFQQARQQFESLNRSR
jgi:nucleoid-associated protein YgaU